MGSIVGCLGLISMKTLLAFALLLVAVTLNAAIPTYKDFIGTNGITVRSNPPNGFIFIDGVGVGGATGAVTQAQLTTSSNRVWDAKIDKLNGVGTNAQFHGTFFATNGAITLGQAGFPITIGGGGNGNIGTNWYQFYYQASQYAIGGPGTGWYANNGSDVTINDTGTLNLAAAATLHMVGGATPNVPAVGYFSFDTDAWAASRGTIVFNDGTSSNFVVATIASDTPADGDVVTWNTGGIIDWKPPSSSTGLTNASATTFAITNRIVYSRNLLPSEVAWDDFEQPRYAASTNLGLSPSGHYWTMKNDSGYYSAGLYLGGGRFEKTNTADGGAIIGALSNLVANAEYTKIGGVLSFRPVTPAGSGQAAVAIICADEFPGFTNDATWLHIVISYDAITFGTNLVTTLYTTPFSPILNAQGERIPFELNFRSNTCIGYVGPYPIQFTHPSLGIMARKNYTLFEVVDVGADATRGAFESVNVGYANEFMQLFGANRINLNTNGLIDSLSVTGKVYDATSWDGDTTVPTRDDVRDKIETLAAASDVTGLISRAISNRDSRVFSLNTPFTNLFAMYGNAGWSYVNNRLAPDPDTFNTNYVMPLYEGGQDEWYIIMTNHVHFRSYSNGIQDPNYRGFAGVNITNYTASDKTLTFTNIMVPLGIYQSVVPAGKVARVQFVYDAGGIFYSVQVQDETTPILKTVSVNGTMTINRDLIIPWEISVAASTVIQATNGPNQILNLGSDTNLTFAPLAGSDASNSIPIKVIFTQDSTGGRVATLNGTTLELDSLPNATSEVDIWIEKGVTNFTTIVRSGRFYAEELAGAGTSNTNFTALADGLRRKYLNGAKTNVNFAAIMRGQTKAHDSIVFCVTNLTATVCTMTLSSVTNKWIPLGGSLVAPFSITNGLWMATETRGTNVFYGAQYMVNPAP